VCCFSRTADIVGWVCGPNVFSPVTPDYGPLRGFSVAYSIESCLGATADTTVSAVLPETPPRTADTVGCVWPIDTDEWRRSPVEYLETPGRAANTVFHRDPRVQYPVENCGHGGVGPRSSASSPDRRLVRSTDDSSARPTSPRRREQRTRWGGSRADDYSSPCPIRSLARPGDRGVLNNSATASPRCALSRLAFSCFSLSSRSASPLQSETTRFSHNCRYSRTAVTQAAPSTYLSSATENRLYIYRRYEANAPGLDPGVEADTP